MNKVCAAVCAHGLFVATLAGLLWRACAHSRTDLLITVDLPIDRGAECVMDLLGFVSALPVKARENQ